jgi:hypothetical protein
MRPVKSENHIIRERQYETRNRVANKVNFTHAVLDDRPTSGETYSIYQTTMFTHAKRGEIHQR